MPIRTGFFILFYAALAASTGFGQGKPSIQFEGVARDAGAVQQGDVIRQVFAFTNKGSGILKILNVEHS